MENIRVKKYLEPRKRLFPKLKVLQMGISVQKEFKVLSSRRRNLRRAM